MIASQALEVAHLVLFVGPHSLLALNSQSLSKKDRLLAFLNTKEAAEYLKKDLRSGDLVLLKGSNTKDHLVRILLARKNSVQCWRDKCGFSRFCSSCPEIYKSI